MVFVNLDFLLHIPDDATPEQVEQWVEEAHSSLESHFDSVDAFVDFDPEYVAYEPTTGIAWHCTPATLENAQREAELAGEGMVAMKASEAEKLSNAWSHGRMYEIERNRR